MFRTSAGPAARQIRQIISISTKVKWVIDFCSLGSLEPENPWLQKLYHVTVWWLDIYRLSNNGETKQIGRVFDLAEAANAVVLDEADHSFANGQTATAQGTKHRCCIHADPI